MRADQPLYWVLVNASGQYATWPTGAAIPAGWRWAGFEGSQRACCGFIEQAWSEARLRSVRQQLDAAEQQAREEDEWD